MCFSAGASFGAAAVLTGIGISSIRKASSLREIAFASVPFIFALQQISEGFVWLTFTNASFKNLSEVPIYLFLTFSHVIWPAWIPFSILLLEQNPERKKIISSLFALGLMLSIYHIYSLFFFTVNTRLAHHHIQYVIGHPDVVRFPASTIYGLVTIVPAFISSIRRMWWLGLFILISYLATYVFYQAYVISVWCFFATLMSVIVYLILKRSMISQRLASEISTRQ